MSKVNISSMKKKYDQRRKGGDYWTPPTGSTLLYLHPPCLENDNSEPTKGVNYVPVTIHYLDGSAVVCLDRNNNPILDHPNIKKGIAKKGVKLTNKTKCPICKAIQEGKMPDNNTYDSRPQTKYLFGVTPIKQRKSKTDSWQSLEPKPCTYFAGSTVYDGITNVFLDLDLDVTDKNEAIYLVLTRTGKGMNTRYQIVGDPKTIKKPVKLSPKFWKLVEKAMENGSADLFNVVVSMVKGQSEVEKLLDGVETVDDDDDEEENDDGGEDDDDDEDEDDDDEEEDDEEEDDEEEDDDDDDEEEDDEDDDDDDDDDEEEDDEDDDEEENDDEDDDGAEEDDEDDDDEDIEEIEKEIERLSKKNSKKEEKTKKVEKEKKAKVEKKKAKKNEKPKKVKKEEKVSKKEEKPKKVKKNKKSKK